MTIQAHDEKSAARLNEWVRRVTSLADEVEQWATGEGWPVQRDQKQIHERSTGDYTVPALRIRGPGGELFLKPVALHIQGADGRVDLEAWPTLNRVKIVGHEGGWQIITDSNVPLPQAWGRETFLELVRHLQS